MKTQWREMLVRAEIPSTTRYHDLRHGAVSLLLSKGVPIPVISKYCGHANPSITMSVYAHMLDSDDGLADSAIDEILS